MKRMIYLHVGNRRNIREKDIIGIFDTESATVSPVTRHYLAAKEKEGLVEAAIEEIPKSFVLYRAPDGKNISASRNSPPPLSWDEWNGRKGTMCGEEPHGKIKQFTK